MKSITRVPKEMVEFEAFARHSGLPVYIFGADIAGKVINELLKRGGIEVEGFIDNNTNKCGKTINEVDVFHASKLNLLDRDSIMLIASTYIGDIIRQLEDLGFYNWAPIADMLEWADRKEVSDLLQGQLRLNHAGGEFTKDFDTFVLTNMVNSQKKYLDASRLYVRSFDLIVTEKCSLKCKDCSNLMQYYESPQDIPEAEIISDLDDICAVCDEINEIRIIGGDPLMNKQFHKAVMYAARKPNVNRVVVYTNGTICPPEEKIAAIAHEKIFVFITTYGELSRRNELLSDLLRKYSIPFNSQPAYGWTDCADIQQHNRTDDENEQVLRMCCAKHFTTLTDGRVFRCPFSANVERLAAIPDFPDDYVNVRGAARLDGRNLEILRNNMRWFLREKRSLRACDFCNGRTYGDPEIAPGVQTKKPIPYLKHDRTIRIPIEVATQL